MGRAINPIAVEGQIEGGVVMGLGYALTEDFTLVNGVPKQKFGTLGLFRATEVPEIQSIIIEKNTEITVFPIDLNEIKEPSHDDFINFLSFNPFRVKLVHD